MNLTTTDQTVAKQWANRPDDQRFLDLDSLYDAVAKRRDNSAEVREALADLAVTLTPGGDDLRLLLPGIDSEAEFTQNSFGSLCSRVKAPAGFFRDQLANAPELAAETLNHCIQNADNEPIMPYIYRNGHTELRAATSPSYGRIYDADVVSAVRRPGDAQGGGLAAP